jgi:hypothetical protein
MKIYYWLKEKIEDWQYEIEVCFCDLKERLDNINILEKYKNNFKGNCIHFLKIIPFLLFLSTYFIFLLKIPNLISCFSLNGSDFLLLFLVEIIIIVSIVVFVLIKLKVSIFAFIFFSHFIFLFKYFIPLSLVYFISFNIFPQDLISKKYVGLSKYEIDYLEDESGYVDEKLITYPCQLFEISDSSYENLLNTVNVEGERIYLSRKFIFWQTSLIYGFDVNNVHEINNLLYSKRILLNLSLLPFLILEFILVGLPFFFGLIGTTLLCYFFNYRFPFNNYSSIRKILNESVGM